MLRKLVVAEEPNGDSNATVWRRSPAQLLQDYSAGESAVESRVGNGVPVGFGCEPRQSDKGSPAAY